MGLVHMQRHARQFPGLAIQEQLYCSWNDPTRQQPSVK